MILPFIKNFQESSDQIAYFNKHHQAISYGAWQRRIQKTIRIISAFHLKPSAIISSYDISEEKALDLFIACLICGYQYFPLNPHLPTDQLPQLCQQKSIHLLFFTSSPFNIDRFGQTRVVTEESEKQKQSKGQGEAFSWPRERHGDQTCLLISTSGSTGTPKTVALSWQNLYYSALGSLQFYQITETDNWLLSLPLFHIGGMIIPLRAMLGGCRFSIPKNIKQLEESLPLHRPTLLSLVPTQLHRLIQCTKIHHILGAAKAILVGGDQCSQKLLEESYRLSLPISVTYGATEFCSQLTATTPGRPTKEMGNTGRPLPFRKVRIKNGQIFAGGQTIFNNYLESSSAEQKKQTWIPTNDIGVLSHFGELIVAGRQDDVFIVGGENCAPWEIEHELEGIQKNTLYHLVGMPHHEYGKLPALVIYSTTYPDISKILRTVSHRIPKIKKPRFIFWVCKDASSYLTKVSRKQSLSLVLSGQAEEVWANTKERDRNENKDLVLSTVYSQNK